MKSKKYFAVSGTAFLLAVGIVTFPAYGCGGHAGGTSSGHMSHGSNRHANAQSNHHAMHDQGSVARLTAEATQHEHGATAAPKAGDVKTQSPPAGDK